MTAKSGNAKRPKRAVIPADVRTLDAVYDILARDLGLPAHFGRNLDALYDALTGDLAGPIEIVVEDAAALEAALGAKARALLKLFREASQARRDFHLRCT